MKVSAIYGITPLAVRQVRAGIKEAEAEPTYDAIAVPPVSLGEGVESLSASLGITPLELVDRLTSGRGLSDLLGADDDDTDADERSTSGVLLDGYV